MENSNLYSIRIIKAYIEYLEKNYPNIDIDPLLEYAGISKYELEDMGFWFSQEQADRFYDIIVEKTSNPNIAKEAGRYAAISASYGVIRQYMTGFIFISAVYSLVEKISSKITRGGYFQTRKIKSNKVEAIFKLKAGVKDKPYQCENRIGTLEAITKTFTGKFAKIEHSTCIHKGDDFCKYIISWDNPFSMLLKRASNYFLFISIICNIILLFYIPWIYIIILLAICFNIFLGVQLYSAKCEIKEIFKNIETQGNTAELLIEEVNMRYNDAILVKEIGQAISMILDIDKLLEFVMQSMSKRLDFDRGIVMLANKAITRLEYKAGYGYNPDNERLLRKTFFHLDNPDSTGIFIDSFKKQSSHLVNDINDISVNLSERSREFLKLVGAQSFICVPIVFKKETLGLLSVDIKRSKRELNQSDLSILLSIAQQIGISINNTRSFQQLQASEEKYRELVENANSIIMRMHTNGEVTFFNEFAQNFFGYTENEILGKSVVGAIVSENESIRSNFLRMLTEINKYPDRYANIQSENILRSKDKVWISWTNRPIRDIDNNVIEILCIGNDNTAQKKAEDEKKALEIQLQRAQKMEAIGTLAGGVAHDLNNILTGIVSYPQLLLMELPEDSPLRDDLSIIMRSGERAITIVQDLLTLARRGVNVSSVVNLNKVISDYINSPEHNKLAQCHSNVHFVVSEGIHLLNVMGSQVHLSKTIMNLVSNAAEAMPDGGKVTVTTENRYIDSPVRGYETVIEGEYVVVSVTDNGIGISQEDLPKIFDPFYSKKVMGKSGTGLGMAVVWGTVKDHEGYIDIQSEIGKGTWFEIYYPAIRDELEDSKVDFDYNTLKGQEKILVVDDGLEQREIATRFLSRLGYDVNSVTNGEEAIEYLKENTADVVLLDMIMDPGIDGLDTYKKIHENNPGQKVIIISGFSETERVKDAIELGVGAYIKKPYVFEDIGYAVRIELDK